jgi:hypothetical protein
VGGLGIVARVKSAIRGQHVQARCSVFSETTKQFYVNDKENPFGDAAGTLYSEISSNVDMFVTQRLFGCYDPTVLNSLKQATNTLASTFDSINGASAGLGGETPSDIPASFPRPSRRRRRISMP